MRTIGFGVLALLSVLSLGMKVFADGTFVPKSEERDYQGSLEQTAQEGIIVHKDGVEDLILKITYQGEPQDFAWVIPFPSVPEIYRESAELFTEMFNYVERAISRTYYRYKRGESEEAAGEAGVEVIARKTVGNYDTATVQEKTKGALNGWLKDNGYVELAGAEKELEYYRELGWVFAAIKVRDAIAVQGSVDLHPVRFRFKTRKQDEMVYPLKLSVFQKAPLDVNLYIFSDSSINIDYDGRGVLTKDFVARYEGGRSRKWSQRRVEGVLPMLRTRQFFLRHYPHDRFFLTNIQALGLKPADIREWSEDLYICPQCVYLLHPSTWYWPQWVALCAAIGLVLLAIGLLARLRRKRKSEAT